MRLLTLGLMGLVLATAPGVVATKSRTVNTPLDTTWRWVGTITNIYGTFSGVAIGPRTILTARHVGEGTFNLLGQSYTVVTSFRPPDAPDPSGGPASKVDLLLLNVDRDLPGFYTLAKSFKIGSLGILVGYGGSGRVRDNGLGYVINTPIGARRAGTAGAIDGRMFVPTIGHTFYSDLKVPGQGIVISGDSGGGWFVGGRLAGSISFNYNDSKIGDLPPIYPDFGFPSANVAGYTASNGAIVPPNRPYCGSGAVDLTRLEVRDWIFANMYKPLTP